MSNNFSSNTTNSNLIDNRYALLKLLGQGTFGRVFLANDLKFSPPRLVALKIFHLQFFSDSQIREDIAREASVLAALDHPNILRIIDYNVTPGLAYIVTNYASGGSLAAKIRPGAGQPPRQMPLPEVARYLEQICDALGEAHSRGLIHRDIKPHNILIDHRNRPLLADFGLAATLGTSQASSQLVDINHSGTPVYMAPEQWEGQAGKASDIYAVGVMAYQLITGLAPYLGTQMELMGHHIKAPIPRLSERAPGLTYPPALDNVFAGVLAKDPRQRTRPAMEFSRGFNAAITQAPPLIIPTNLPLPGLRPEVPPAQPYQTPNPGFSTGSNNPAYATRPLSQPSSPPTNHIQSGPPPNPAYTPRPNPIGQPGIGSQPYVNQYQTLQPVSQPPALEKKPARRWNKVLVAIGGVGVVLLLVLIGAIVFIFGGLGPKPPVATIALAATVTPSLNQTTAPPVTTLAPVATTALPVATTALPTQAAKVQPTLKLLVATPVLPGHSLGVNTVAFSPDGKTIVTGSDDNTLKIRETATGKILATLQNHIDLVQSAAYSPHGKIIASASRDKTLKLWDAASGKVLNTLEGHASGVRSVAFSPNGKTLVSASNDKTVRLWEVATGKLLNTLSGHTGIVNSAIFSPDGKMIASASDDNTIKLWEAATGNLINTLVGQDSYIRSIAFSPNGKTLVAGNADNIIKLWDVASGKPLNSLTGHTGPIKVVAFSPEGKTIASGGQDSTFKLWDAATGKLLNSIQYNLNWLTFSPDGKTLATASPDKTVKLWDVASGQPLNSYHNQTDLILSVAISQDGKTLVSSSDDIIIKIWDTVSGKTVTTLQGHTASVRSVAISPDGKTVASASYDKTLKLWDVSSGKVISTMTDTAGAVVFSPDGKLLASASDDNTVKLWYADSGKLINTLQGHTESVTAVAFSLDSRTIASTSADHTVKLWDATTGKLLNSYEDTAGGLAFSPDGKLLALAGTDKTVKLLDIATGKFVTTMTGHVSAVSFVAFTKDSKYVISGGTDKVVKIWDLAGTELYSTTVDQTFGLNALSLTPDGTLLLTGHLDGSLKVWQVQF